MFTYFCTAPSLKQLPGFVCCTKPNAYNNVVVQYAAECAKIRFHVMEGKSANRP
jgi:hypothetical protein